MDIGDLIGPASSVAVFSGAIAALLKARAKEREAAAILPVKVAETAAVKARTEDTAQHAILAEFREEKAERKREREQMEAAMLSLRSRADVQEKALDHARTATTKLQWRIDEVTSELETTRRRVVELEGQNVAQSEQIQALRGRLRELEEERDRWRRMAEAATNERAEAVIAIGSGHTTSGPASLTPVPKPMPGLMAPTRVPPMPSVPHESRIGLKK